MELEVNNPFSGLLNYSGTSNVKDLREKVDSFKGFVLKSKISHHVVNDLLNFCTWMKDRPDLDLDVEEECIVPIIKFFLEDANQEVGKTAYSHLAVMINRGKISKQSLENHFCSYLAKVINDGFDDDFRLQAINTLFELIFYIDKEVIAREIIPEISKLCLNPNTDATMKTACVSRLDKLASRLERNLTEKTIIPLYEKMAHEKYVIRKTCVEVSVALSYICSKEVREQVLVPIYLSFLKDSLKFVSDLALIALGPFIASFADSEGSEHHQTFNEVLMNNIYNFNYGPINFSLSNANFRDDFIYDIVPDYNDSESSWYPDSNYDFKYRSAYGRRGNEFMIDSKLAGEDENKRGLTPVSLDDDEDLDETKEAEEAAKDEDADEAKNEFNSFNYWREPIMSIDELLDVDENSGSDQEKDEDRGKAKDYLCKLYSNKQREEETIAKNIEKCLKLLKDNVVPNKLLFYFLKNLLSNYGSSVYHADINCICAFSLPAVALTLGRENWPCLRFAFNVLVMGMNSNIKLILASSLHELAKIVGPFYTNLDILPALLAFMRHSDEIRERILKNLSPLVNSFEKNDQNKILRKLPAFYKLDNEYNWRFRVDFIKQFIELVPLYDKQKQFSQIIMPMIFSLLEDKVAEVRKCSIPLLVVTIQHFYDANKKVLISGRLKESILDQVHYKFCQSKKWTFRQLYILICENIVQSVALPVDTFREKLLSPLLALAKDKVINVRLTLSRVLASELFHKYFETGRDLADTIELLSGDEDKDVRSYFVVPGKEEEETALNNENRLYKFDDLQMKIGRDLFYDELLWTNEKTDEALNSLSSIEKLTDHIESGSGRSYGDSALIGSDELLSKHVTSEVLDSEESEKDNLNEFVKRKDLDTGLVFGGGLTSREENRMEMESETDEFSEKIKSLRIHVKPVEGELASETTSETTSETKSETAREMASETAGQTASETTSEIASETTSEAASAEPPPPPIEGVAEESA